MVKAAKLEGPSSLLPDARSFDDVAQFLKARAQENQLPPD
jgi:hypothetical protein